MSNLNIQQKVALAAQKSKETKNKDVVLSDAELKLKEWNEVTKPSLTEKQSAQIEAIQAKLAPLGGYKELDVYEIGRKYDWNDVVLESVTNGLLQKYEEAGDFAGWKEVKKPGKSQAPTKKKAKEAEDVRENRSRRNEGRYDRYEDEVFGRRNEREGSGDFKRRAQRGQSVEAGGRRNYQRDRGGRYDDFQDRYYEREQYGNRREPSRRRYNREERYEEDQRTDRREFANRIRNRNNEIITYVRKAQQDPQPQERQEENPERQERQDRQERHEREDRHEKHEKHEKHERRERQEKQESLQLESRDQQEERQEQRERPRRREKSKNPEQNPRKQQATENYGRKGRYEKVIYVPKTQSQNTEHQQQQQTQETTSSRTNRHAEKTENTRVNDRETMKPSQTKKETVSSSNTTGSNANVRHYDQNNIHEFFRNNAGLTESPKKEVHKVTEKTEVVHKPKQEEKKSVPLPRVENDHASQTVQKPVLGFNDNRQKEKTPQQQTEAHNQPIGHQRIQNAQATTHNAFGSHQTHTSHQTHQAHPTHQTQTSHSTQQNTQTNPTQGSHIDNQQQQQQQYFLQQQQYMMSQFPQQGFFNPYMYFQQPQGFGTTNTNKEEQAQTYPPGFNPQEIPNMYQMPMILIPQPNGTTIFQPMYSMMAPQTNAGLGGQNKGDGDQQKNFQQQYYQFPMMSMPTEYYGVDDKKPSQGQYDTGSFFNFQANEGDFKKNQNSNASGFQQQGMGFPMIPSMIPTHQMGQFPYQQFQGKSHDNSGSHGWK